MVTDAQNEHYREQRLAEVCSQKRAYLYQGDAEEIAAQHYACTTCSGGGWVMGAYRCPACAKWHLGHHAPDPPR